MGVVYAARDRRLGRDVAIKLLREETGDRLRDEARALARVAHPNVVQVFDVDRWSGPGAEGLADGAPLFVSMELVDGWSLRRWLMAERPAPGAILDVLRDAGEGLAAVHEAGLVHRDFKPDNVLVGRDGRARVTDFGLARAGAPEGASPAGESGVAGTPAYMAPEQLAGRGATAASDQFAYCASLAEALCGSRPFEARDAAGLAAAYARGAPPALALPPGSEPLARVLERGLALDPAARFPSMRALLDALAIARAPRPSGHLRVNAIVNALLAVLHWALTIGMFGGLGPAPAPVEEVSGPPDVPGGIVAAYAMLGLLLAATCWIMIWGPVGALLTPLNAYGLWRGRAWARWTALLYAAMSLPVVPLAPYVVYAFATLLRPALTSRDRR
jgi:serine/threonine protein kinase